MINGHDVCLLGLYVQEYGADCPPPNTNRVYISYLDTVRYVGPPNARTPLFHSVLIGYLADAAARGFRYAHLWVAPPAAGTDYIFHVKQDDEKHKNRPMPPSKLRGWYEAMHRLPPPFALLTPSHAFSRLHPPPAFSHLLTPSHTFTRFRNLPQV